MSNRINPVDQGMLGKTGDKAGSKVDSKVDETGSTPKVGGGDATAGRAAGGAPATADTVELTSSAKLLERLDKTLAGLSAVDTQRIDAVRTAIENGEYRIDAERIAEAMLRFERELGE